MPNEEEIPRCPRCSNPERMSSMAEAAARLEERVENLRQDTQRRHGENRDILQEILQQTKKTNGDVTELKAWRAAHDAAAISAEDITGLRLAQIKEQFGQFSTRVEDADAALKILRDDKIKAEEGKRLLVLLWGPIGAALVALMSVVGHLLAKKLGW